LTYKAFFISSIIAITIAGHWLPWYYFALLLLIPLSLLFFACINLSWNFFIPSLCKADTTEKVVALTFDDGPAQYTESILNTLKQQNVSGAFFCIGKNIAGKEETLQRIKDEGHIIGNHSYSHAYWFDMWSAAKMMADMKDMSSLVQKTSGITPVLFRPPYGVINFNLAAAIKGKKYTSIGWNIRSFDTKIKDKQKLTSRIISQLKPGSIILLHDSMQITAEILPELIKQIQANGYKFLRLDKMLNIDAYA
jgi:peptidoglycan/xylan/chitin deacetylase (PgdA/CDA1 family)